VRIGLLGPADEPHCRRVAGALEALGAKPLHIDTSTFDETHRFSLRRTTATANGEPLDDVNAFYLRNILSPVPYVYAENDSYRLYEDWYQDYMVNIEKHGFLLSWLLALLAQGKFVVNPPHLGGINSLKAFQMFRLRQLGLPIPRTLITNDPEEARAFLTLVGPAVVKPSMGGAYCESVTPEVLERLPLIVRSPVIFQEQVRGVDLRVTAVADKILSVVEIESDALDFRDDSRYRDGRPVYKEAVLPPEVERMCMEAMEASGLLFSGIDLKRTPSGEYVLIELNYSPVWDGIQQIMGHPIAEGLAAYLIACAKSVQAAPKQEKPVLPPSLAPKQKNFFYYAAPKPSDP
jgi:glutathione synthase/RimK-type ligase-like ATP-grasp enzyme